MDKNEVLNKIMSSIEKGYIDINQFDEPEEFKLIKEYVSEHIPKKIYEILKDEGEYSEHAIYPVYITENKNNAISAFHKIVEVENKKLAKDESFFDTNYIYLVEMVEEDYLFKDKEVLTAEWKYDSDQEKVVSKIREHENGE